VILVTDDTSLDYTAEVTFAATTATFRDSKDITIPVETIGEFGYFDIRNLICVGKVDHQFDIKMCNAYGCSNVVTFDVQPLLAPTTLRSVEVTAGTVSISWDELIQDPGNLPLKYYQVEYRDESGGENDYDIAPTIRATDGPKKFMLGGLWHSKRIFIRVKAYNAFNDWAKKNRFTRTVLFGFLRNYKSFYEEIYWSICTVCTDINIKNRRSYYCRVEPSV
jgi:hypothetical protein